MACTMEGLPLLSIIAGTTYGIRLAVSFNNAVNTNNGS